MRRDLTDLTGRCAAARPSASPCSAASPGASAVDAERRIRYANPQAMRLLGGSRSRRRSGRFCGDVLQPRARSAGRRPLRDRLPDPARARSSSGSARAAETLCLGGRQHALDGDRHAAPVAGPAGASAARRNRVSRPRAARANRCSATSVRVPHVAGRAARLGRDAARWPPRPRPRPAGRTAGERRARRAAPDAADRQPARERAHRVRAARDPAPLESTSSGGRRGAGAARAAVHAAAVARDARRRASRRAATAAMLATAPGSGSPPDRPTIRPSSKSSGGPRP